MVHPYVSMTLNNKCCNMNTGSSIKSHTQKQHRLSCSLKIKPTSLTSHSCEYNAEHNATWKSPIPLADGLSFTGRTATWRNNLPAGFITVMNDCSLVSDTLGKVGHDEPFSFKKRPVAHWWMLHRPYSSHELWTSTHSIIFAYTQAYDCSLLQAVGNATEVARIDKV